MYWGVVEHVRGSVILTGTTNKADLEVGPIMAPAVRTAGTYYVATPVQPWLDEDDKEHAALLQRLLADVVASGFFQALPMERGR